MNQDPCAQIVFEVKKDQDDFDAIASGSHTSMPLSKASSGITHEYTASPGPTTVRPLRRSSLNPFALTVPQVYIYSTRESS